MGGGTHGGNPPRAAQVRDQERAGLRLRSRTHPPPLLLRASRSSVGEECVDGAGGLTDVAEHQANALRVGSEEAKDWARAGEARHDSSGGDTMVSLVKLTCKPLVLSRNGAGAGLDCSGSDAPNVGSLIVLSALEHTQNTAQNRHPISVTL